MQTIRVISFDLDDTLWDNQPVIRKAEAALQAFLASEHPRISTALAPADMQGLIAKVDPAIRFDLTATRKAVLRLAAEQVGYTQSQANDVAEVGFSVFAEARSRVELFAGVTEMLAALAINYSLIALTNGNVDLTAVPVAPAASAVLPVEASHHSSVACLADYFKLHLSAGDLGCAKPHADFYPRALTRINQHIGAQHAAAITPQACCHIGDSWLNDVQAPLAAGWQAIWFNPRATEQPAVAAVVDAAGEDAAEKAVTEVQHLDEIPGKVAALQLDA